MPRLLLDTHSFLWFVTADPKLSASAQRLIATGTNEPLLSVACVWEIAIKVSIGRLPLPEPLHRVH
jgi:PIN domain nuclease of toxin-antitoxin system